MIVDEVLRMTNEVHVLCARLRHEFIASGQAGVRTQLERIAFSHDLTKALLINMCAIHAAALKTEGNLLVDPAEVGDAVIKTLNSFNKDAT